MKPTHSKADCSRIAGRPSTAAAGATGERICVSSRRGRTRMLKEEWGRVHPAVAEGARERFQRRTHTAMSAYPFFEINCAVFLKNCMIWVRRSRR